MQLGLYSLLIPCLPPGFKVGNVGLSYNEAASHFAMWCVVNAPLLLGADLVGLRNRPEYLAILLNDDLIALNQDALGFQGRRVGGANPTGVELWYKTLADGSVAAALLNKGQESQTGTVDFGKVNDTMASSWRCGNCCGCRLDCQPLEVCKYTIAGRTKSCRLPQEVSLPVYARTARWSIA